jgi:hypothetical protein
MRSARFVCWFTTLLSILVLAQSGRAPLRNQPNEPPIAQKPHPDLPPNPPLARRVRFAQERARTLRTTTDLTGALLASGLSFAPVVDYGSGRNGAFSVAVADVNGDGKPDLVVANECAEGSCTNGSVGVLLGNGDGTFKTAVSYGSGGYQSRSVAVADVNGDGKLDLLVTSCCGAPGIVGVLLGNGDGTFQPVVTYDSGGNYPLTVVVADLNGDGRPDLVVANASGSGNGDGSVSVLLGNGDGTFQTAVSYDSGGNDANSVAVGDVNGDGKPDLLAVNACNSSNNCSGGLVGVLLGNGDGTFQPAVTYNSGGYGGLAVAVADVNGDGKPDLLVANCAGNNGNCNGNDGVVGVLLGNGDGTFQTPVAYDSGGYDTNSVAVGDVNGDSKPDLICANDSSPVGTVGVLLGNGDGTFQPAVTYNSDSQQAIGSASLSLAVADVNGDGKPDLLVAGLAETVGVLINTTSQVTTTALISSLNPSNFGQPVTFTATVTGQQGFYKGTPTGTVSFYDGKRNIGNSNVNNSGVAILTTSTLAVGTHSIRATYNGDAHFLPSTSPVLHQIVQGAIVVLSPTRLGFGKETVGIASTPKVAILTNPGNIALAITSLQITGANSSDFAEKNDCGASVPPKGECKINVTFTPTATGTRNAAVSITDNAPGSPQSVPLTGVGVLPAVTLSPTSLTFPTQLVFTTSRAQPVTLTNSGAGVLKINHIGVTGPFPQTNNCPRSLSPGANCTISVKFHPGNKGVFHGAVRVMDNAPDSPQEVQLTGTGTFVQLTPTKLGFGTQPVGTRSLPRRITLTNKGDSAVKITGIAITGKDSGDFAETNNCGKSVASGASCFIKVTFKPLVKGKRVADVSVYDNGGGNPQGVGLAGTGT